MDLVAHIADWLAGRLAGRRRRARLRRALPLAYERLQREMWAEDGQPADEVRLATARTLVREWARQLVEREEEAATIDAMSDEALVTWLAEDLRPHHRRVMEKHRPKRVHAPGAGGRS